MGVDGTVSAAGIFCDCHGSAYDAQGNVLRGPGWAPLAHYAITADAAAALTIHGDELVPESARLVL